MRRFVIGDIHGCAKALRTVIETINPERDDELIFLGDYVDRGPDSRNVVDQIIELQSRCRVVAVRGNHELMMLAIINRGLDDTVWLANGGRATITSYGGNLSKVPSSHLQFFSQLLPFYENEDTICVHAGYHPMLPMNEQEPGTLYWDHLASQLPPAHVSGKRVFIGHTPQPHGNVLDAGHLVCIDTYCFGGGFLTAFDLDSNHVIQVNYHGHLRRDGAALMAGGVRRMRNRLTAYIQQQWSKLRQAQADQKTRTESLPIDKATR